jgi:hypothetical protein
VVFQELSSPARYIAIYQSNESGTVGPITATDPTDRGVLSVLHPIVGYDGAPATFLVTLLDQTKGIVDASYANFPSLYTQGTDGLTTTPAAISTATKDDTAPPPLFTYRNTGAAGDTLAGSGLIRRTSVSVDLPNYGTEDWTFDQSTDRWSMTSGGPSISVANLIIEDVGYSTVAVNAKHGITTTQAGVVGSDTVQVFSGSASGGTGGTGASGHWSKPHSGLVTNYFDSNGAPMAFSPGPTWVILAPSGTTVSSSGQ